MNFIEGYKKIMIMDIETAAVPTNIGLTNLEGKILMYLNISRHCYNINTAMLVIIIINVTYTELKCQSKSNHMAPCVLVGG